MKRPTDRKTQRLCTQIYVEKKTGRPHIVALQLNEYIFSLIIPSAQKRKGRIYAKTMEPSVIAVSHCRAGSFDWRDLSTPRPQSPHARHDRCGGIANRLELQ
jgi:hypothetical protein